MVLSMVLSMCPLCSHWKRIPVLHTLQGFVWQGTAHFEKHSFTHYEITWSMVQPDLNKYYSNVCTKCMNHKAQNPSPSLTLIISKADRPLISGDTCENSSLFRGAMARFRMLIFCKWQVLTQGCPGIKQPQAFSDSHSFLCFSIRVSSEGVAQVISCQSYQPSVVWNPDVAEFRVLQMWVSSEFQLSISHHSHKAFPVLLESPCNSL